VFLVHGLGGHGGQFKRLATDLNHCGYEVLAPDLPGHGLSAGERGWIRQWADLRNALAGVIEPLLCGPSRPPSFLFGHSLGGAVVVDLLLDRQNGAHPLPIAGAILCNPAIASDGIQRWRLLVARLFSRFHPHFSLDPGFALETASRDPAVLSAYAADPLHHHGPAGLRIPGGHRPDPPPGPGTAHARAAAAERCRSGHPAGAGPPLLRNPGE
jgi:alpha-beta hydrolase superfamily lysophospholipase